MTPRQEFINHLKWLDENQPFTDIEHATYSVQQKNFIRGIQIANRKTKKEAIKEFKKIRGKKDRIQRTRDRIQESYDGRIVIAGKAPLKQVYVPKPKYEYKGVVKKAVPEVVSRYVVDRTSGKTRRYIDTQTGENISRRERDKRIAQEL